MLFKMLQGAATPSGLRGEAALPCYVSCLSILLFITRVCLGQGAHKLHDRPREQLTVWIRPTGWLDILSVVRFVITSQEGGLLAVDAPRLYGNLRRSEDIGVGRPKAGYFLSHVSDARVHDDKPREKAHAPS